MKLIMASANEHKIQEIRSQLPTEISLISMSEAGFYDEIEENGETFQQNALIKARAIHVQTLQNCFAEDSGLEIDSLNGEPGVRSARYSADHKSSLDNLQLVLYKLSNQKNRKARFKTVIALIYNSKEYVFEGVAEGEIAYSITGISGFGYDPIFIPEMSNQTFAQMTTAEKNQISHRGKAVKQLLNFLNLQQNSA
ncbi:MAG: RdgB/HAM1 family non-canonical purine NTP pyrophosphatase [Saprospiraceae bacterium]|nr:RdgB/HAM1 family non-canonical purine NTP pyrophosphatase [Saprospiraceae bacterium]